MTKSMLFFIAVLIVALGARPVLAGDGREYVGVTTDTTRPDVGIIALHDLCEADFPGSRMCSSSDIIRNGGVGAALPPAGAWINPAPIPVTPVGFASDLSGAANTYPGSLACFSWISAGLGDKGEFIPRSLTTWRGQAPPVVCFQRLLPVACCAERKGKK